MTLPVEQVIERISGSTVAVGVLLVVLALLEPTAVTSMPSIILPLFVAGVKSEGLIVKGLEVSFPAVVIAAGMIANVLPWPELSTIRSSSSSGVRHRRRRTRGNSFEVFIRPSLASDRIGK